MPKAVMLLVVAGMACALGVVGALLYLRSEPAVDQKQVVSQWPGGLPTLVDIDGDGVDDLIWQSEYEQLTATSGKTWKPLWQVASRGGVLLAADKLVVTLDRDVVVRSLRDGSELSRDHKSDVVQQACVKDGVLWTRALDEVVSGISLSGGAAQKASKLPCGEELARFEAPCRHASARCVIGKDPIEGFSIFSESDHARIELKHPGSPEVTVWGGNAANAIRTVVDPVGKRIEAVDLWNEHLFIKQSPDVICVNARTSAIEWKLPLVFDNNDEMRVQRGRLYLSGSGHRNHKRLMIYDAATGALIAKLGA